MQWPHEVGGPLPASVWRRGTEGEVRWQAIPRRRGVFEVSPVWLRVESPMGLWWRRRVVEAPMRVRILPDLRGPAADVIGEELRDEGHGAGAGPHPTGSELRGLRPFQRGDDPRHVDWKATARFGAPIVREWEPDRRRVVLIAVDAGRLMRAEHDGESKLDASLRAVARLGLAAQSRGDRVGLVLYAHQVLRYVPPLWGSGQVERLLRLASDVQALPVESDLGAAAPLLMSVGRRCLAVVITDVMDRSTGQSLAAAVAQLRVRHATLVAMVRDPHLDDALAAPVRSPFDAYRRAAAELSARERHETLTALRARGVPALDLSMRTVALETVREYLDARWVARW